MFIKMLIIVINILLINNVFAAQDSYTLMANTTTKIKENGICKIVTNNSAFNWIAPTKLTADLNAFISNAPSGVSSADCLCLATTISTCTLPQGTSGASGIAGTCVGGYSGSCTADCTLDTWNVASNNCTACAWSTEFASGPAHGGESTCSSIGASTGGNCSISNQWCYTNSSCQTGNCPQLNCSCGTPPTDCIATTIAHCSLSASVSGAPASGACETGYTSGSCSYTCNASNWSETTTNTCALPTLQYSAGGPSCDGMNSSCAYYGVSYSSVCLGGPGTTCLTSGEKCLYGSSAPYMILTCNGTTAPVKGCNISASGSYNNGVSWTHYIWNGGASGALSSFLNSSSLTTSSSQSPTSCNIDALAANGSMYEGEVKTLTDSTNPNTGTITLTCSGSTDTTYGTVNVSGGICNTSGPLSKLASPVIGRYNINGQMLYPDCASMSFFPGESCASRPQYTCHSKATGSEGSVMYCDLGVAAGQCGTAVSGSPTMPTTNLCNVGAATQVLDTGSNWTWACGSTGANPVLCIAPKISSNGHWASTGTYSPNGPYVWCLGNQTNSVNALGKPCSPIGSFCNMWTYGLPLMKCQ